jgi:hypothetical protein
MAIVNLMVRGHPPPWQISGDWAPSLLQPQCMLLMDLGYFQKTSVQMPLGQQTFSAHWRW